ASAAIDLDDPLPIFLEPRIAKRVFRTADRDDLPSKAKHGGVLNNSKLGKGSAASRAACRRAQAQGQKLADIYQQKSGGLRHSSVPPCLRGGCSRQRHRNPHAVLPRKLLSLVIARVH